jgi:hypothetical protein
MAKRLPARNLGGRYRMRNARWRSVDIRNLGAFTYLFAKLLTWPLLPDNCPFDGAASMGCLQHGGAKFIEAEAVVHWSDKQQL